MNAVYAALLQYNTLPRGRQHSPVVLRRSVERQETGTGSGPQQHVRSSARPRQVDRPQGNSGARLQPVRSDEVEKPGSEAVGLWTGTHPGSAVASGRVTPADFETGGRAVVPFAGARCAELPGCAGAEAERKPAQRAAPAAR